MPMCQGVQDSQVHKVTGGPHVRAADRSLAREPHSPRGRQQRHYQDSTDTHCQAGRLLLLPERVHERRYLLQQSDTIVHHHRVAILVPSLREFFCCSFSLVAFFYLKYCSELIESTRGM